MVSDLPIILVFQANQKQEVNETSTFGITYMVNSSTPSNLSIQNKNTGKLSVLVFRHTPWPLQKPQPSVFRQLSTFVQHQTSQAASSQVQSRSLWIVCFYRIVLTKTLKRIFKTRNKKKRRLYLNSFKIKIFCKSLYCVFCNMKCLNINESSFIYFNHVVIKTNNLNLTYFRWTYTNK